MNIKSSSESVMLFNLIIYCLCKENKNKTFSDTLKSGEMKAINNIINIGTPLGVVTLYLVLNQYSNLIVRSNILYHDFFKVYLYNLESNKFEEDNSFYLYGLSKNDIEKITGYVLNNDEKRKDNIGEQIEKIINSLKINL